MQRPCDVCKRQHCPDHCKPRQDYIRALRKRGMRDEYQKEVAMPKLR